MASGASDRAGGTVAIFVAAEDVLRIQVLGSFRVAVGPREVDERAWGLRKASGLVKLLALAHGHRLHRERVIDALWPELSLAAGNNSLHRTLHAARRALDPDRAAGTRVRYLTLSDDILNLGPADCVVVDADVFREAAAAAHQTRDVAAYRRAIALYGGDLLPDDLYDDWATVAREALRERYAALLAEAAQRFAAHGESEEAIQTLRVLVAADPIREDAHVALMHLYADSGQRYDALRQYQQLRVALRAELAAEPADDTQRLYAAIQAGTFPAVRVTRPLDSAERDVGRATGHAAMETGAEAAPAGSHSALAAEPATLPGYPTSFVGRVREHEELSALLAANRLVTVVGPGGCGKTRLAMHTVQRLRSAYAHGVCLVELGSLADTALVPQAVALALGIREQGDCPLAETLAAALAPLRLLLVLDNCEHLRAACAELADELLQVCPHLRILATSRRPLGLTAETAWRLRPLATPDPDALPPFAALQDYDAIRLFAARAAASRPGFALTAHNADAVVRVCYRLDGLPLAIELAAGRRRVLTVEQIAARLDDALALLGGGPDGVPRQATLRATIAWSWELLAEPERVLLRRLAVFSGGCTLDAAEAIGAGDELERAQVLDLLARLVDQSLVVVVEHDETLRYRLLDTIRQFAVARLREVGEEVGLRLRHAQWLLEFVAEAEAGLRGSEQSLWLARLDAENDNLRAALAWACGSGAIELAGRMAGPAARYWYLRGTLREGQRWLQRILELDDALGRISPASVRARVLQESGVLALYQGDFSRAHAACEESLRHWRTLGDLLGMNVSLTVLAGVAEARGDYQRAADLNAECLDLARELGDPDRIMIGLSNLADELVPLGELARAEALYAESLALAQQSGNQHRTAMALTNLGKIALRQGNAAGAMASLERALAIMRALNIPRGAAEALVPLAELALARGASEQAIARYLEALNEYRHADAGLEVAQAIEGLSRTLAAGQQGEHAAQLLGVAETLRERLRAPRASDEAARHQADVAALHAQLDDRTFATALAAGRELPIEQVIAGLGSEPSPGTYMDWAPPVDAPSERTAPRPLRRDNRSAPIPLTPREHQIAELVSAGLTNREIAVRLQIAPRTADTHVANVLAKLDLRSRAEVGPWLRANVNAS